MEIIKYAFFKLFAITLGTILALGVLEIGVRIFAPQQLLTLRPDIWIPDSSVGHRLAPNLNTTVNTGEREVRLITDINGHRIGTKGGGASEYRVLVLGDSHIEALQVEYEQTFPALLEKIMTKEMKKSVAFVSSGVSGWNPENYLVEERIELFRIDYDLVLIFLYIGNDFIYEKANIILPRKSHVPLVSWPPETFNFRKFIDAIGHPTYAYLRQHSHLIVFSKNLFLELLVRLGFTKMHFPEVFLRSEVNSPTWDITTNVCRDIALEAEKIGIPVLFMLLPTDFQLDQQLGNNFALGAGLELSQVNFYQPNIIMSKKFKNHGLRLIDLKPALQNAHSKGIKTHGRVDRHLAPDGHRIVAEELKHLLVKEILGAGVGNQD